MPTSDDANDRRGGRLDRNTRSDQRGYGNAPADRTWSQSHPRDPRDQQRGGGYDQTAPGRQPSFSRHSLEGRYPDRPQQPAPQESFRADYQQPAPQDDRYRHQPGPEWDAPPPRYPAQGQGQGYDPQGYAGGAYQPQDVPPRDSLYGDPSLPSSPPMRPGGYGVEPLYDDYAQAPGIPRDDLYDRAPAPQREVPQAARPESVSRAYADQHGTQDYERTLGARIARDAAPSRFYLPEEQQVGVGFGQQATPHDQLYTSGHFEPQEEPAPLQGYGDPSYVRPLDEEPAWADDRMAAADDPYRGGLPIEHRGNADDLDADFFSDEDDFDHEEPLPPRKSRKKLIAAVLVGAVAIGGGSAYVYKSVIGGGPQIGPDGTPLVRADSGPAKESPDDPGGRQFSGGEKSIYDRLTPEGPASASPSSNSETQTASLSTGTASDENVSAASGTTLEDRIKEALRRANRADGTAAVAPVRSGPDQPIVVRSETYRPDGTRLEAEGPAPGAPRAVMDTANLPPPFGPGPGGGQATASVTAAPAPGLPTGGRPSVQVIRPPAQPEAPQRVAVASPNTASPSARRDDAGSATLNAPPSAASRPSAPAPAPVRTAALSGGHFVQMKASNDEKRALAEISDINDKFGVVLGGVPVSSKAVDLGEKGVWFRLMAGPLPSKEAATELCNKLKGAGLPNCLIRSE